MNEDLSLFPDATPAPSHIGNRKRKPLADRMRPRTLEEFVGQGHLVGEGTFLSHSIQDDEISSIILWGPPGTGKTTLAHIISAATQSTFVAFSAVTSGIKEIREVVDNARRVNRRTIIFIDEIHRFNKAQQDAFLPHVEDGTIVLIGATTENPSFEVNSPLLSRSRVLVLNALTADDIATIIRRALEDTERGLGNLRVTIADDALETLTSFADGDARQALNTLELAVYSALRRKENPPLVSRADIEQASQQKTMLYDRAGEEHYNIISAIHKSMRGSDPDAALYWFCRMLEGGEDPLYIARRIVRFASEDVGNADPHALLVAMAAIQTYQFVGSPEGELAIAQAIVHCATAPKSNALYTAYSKARRDAKNHGALPVPLHIRNAPTRLMRDVGYGSGYEYDHDAEDSFSGQEHLPDTLIGTTYYRPRDIGNEKLIRERMAWWSEKKRQRRENEEK